MSLLGRGKLSQGNSPGLSAHMASLVNCAKRLRKKLYQSDTQSFRKQRRGQHFPTLYDHHPDTKTKDTAKKAEKKTTEQHLP